MASKTLTPSLVKLYRGILTAHRALPAKHRELGDAYVKEEFRKHRGAAPCCAECGAGLIGGHYAE